MYTSSSLTTHHSHTPSTTTWLEPDTLRILLLPLSALNILSIYKYSFWKITVAAPATVAMSWRYRMIINIYSRNSSCYYRSKYEHNELYMVNIICVKLLVLLYYYITMEINSNIISRSVIRNIPKYSQVYICMHKSTFNHNCIPPLH